MAGGAQPFDVLQAADQPHAELDGVVLQPPYRYGTHRREPLEVGQHAAIVVQGIHAADLEPDLACDGGAALTFEADEAEGLLLRDQRDGRALADSSEACRRESTDVSPWTGRARNA